MLTLTWCFSSWGNSANQVYLVGSARMRRTPSGSAGQQAAANSGWQWMGDENQRSVRRASRLLLVSIMVDLLLWRA